MVSVLKPGPMCTHSEFVDACGVPKPGFWGSPRLYPGVTCHYSCWCLHFLLLSQHPFLFQAVLIAV